MTQKEAILNYMRTGKSITSTHAIEMFGATRLAAIIYTLKDEGYCFITKDIRVVDRYGTPKTIAEYRLESKPIGDLFDNRPKINYGN